MTSTASPPEPPTRHRPRRRADPPPKLAEGIELIGEYEGSGFKETPYIARRADGQVIQLTHLLHLVAEGADGRRPPAEIAERVTETFGRKVSADNVRFLVEKKLRPLGVLAAADGSNPEMTRSDPMLALKFRAALIPENVSRALTTIFRPLFWPPVIVAVLGALAVLDGWLFFVHGVGQSSRQLLYQPAWLLVVFGLIVVSAAFHETGHATACRYGGAKPGVMGAGLYIVWPAFYTDVTDAYRLSRAGRLRTDLGGVYFNVVFSLLTAAAYFATGFEPLLVVIVLQHMEIFHQFLPFLRLDGYYIISDLTGVPDMFARIKPTLRSLVPGREPEPAVTALKPWVRVVTSVYVITLVPALALMFAFLLISAPRMFATAWDSLFVQGARVGAAFTGGGILSGLAGVVQIVSLMLPLTGLTLTSARAGQRLSVAAWGRSAGRPLLRGGLVTGTLAAAALTVFVLWPNGDYRPLQPGERGTVQGGLEAVADIPTGRPGLTEQRESELGGAPTRIERYGSEAADRPASEDGAPDRTGRLGAEAEPRDTLGSEPGERSRGSRERERDRAPAGEEAPAPDADAPRDRVPASPSAPEPPAPEGERGSGARGGGPSDSRPRPPRSESEPPPTETAPAAPPPPTTTAP
ncbi:MAG: hypothetical protein ACR2KD_01065 [Thermoleophilaceae bacterium]